MEAQKYLEKYLSELDKEEVMQKKCNGEITLNKRHEAISKHNAELIRAHVERVKALPSEPGYKRLFLVASRLKRITEMLNQKELDKLTEQDLITLNNIMRKKGLESAGDYRKSLRQFLRLKDKKKYFDLIDSDYMKTTSKKGKILVDPETFWEQEHIEAYLRESKKYSLRQSAWAGLWSSTGCRPGEIMSMKKKDLEFKDGYLKVIVPEGKTGKRLVVLNGNNAPAVWQYIKPYWETLNEDDKLFNYHWAFANRVHKKICKRASIPKDKDWSFYMARKLNLTKFYNTLGLAKASAMAGHTPGSKSMRHYVGLSESQMIQERPVEVSVKYCPNPGCGKAHETHETQCKSCGAPLDRKKYADILNTISNDKIEAIAELVKEKMMIKTLG